MCVDVYAFTHVTHICTYLFLFLFFFWPCHAACKILVSQPGIEPMPPAVEAQSLNHWAAREVPVCIYFIYLLFFWYISVGFFFFFLIDWLIGCVGSSLLCTAFLQLPRAGATLHCGVRASHCGGFSCRGARVAGARASVVVQPVYFKWVNCMVSELYLKKLFFFKVSLSTFFF